MFVYIHFMTKPAHGGNDGAAAYSAVQFVLTSKQFKKKNTYMQVNDFFINWKCQ